MIAERVDALEGQGNPTLAFQASGIEGIKIKITAKAPTQSQVGALLDEEETRIRALVGHLIFGVDDENMEAAILNTLRRRGQTLAVAESLTGGMIGSRLTAVPGASEVFKGAMVTYASELKFDLLNVTPGPVVSEQCAREMAAGVKRALSADIGISTTGVAGPDEQEGQPVGTVFVGVSTPGKTIAKQLKLPPPRERIREFTVINALDFLRLNLD